MTKSQVIEGLVIFYLKHKVLAMIYSPKYK